MVATGVTSALSPARSRHRRATRNQADIEQDWRRADGNHEHEHEQANRGFHESHHIVALTDSSGGHFDVHQLARRIDARQNTRLVVFS
jgi:hypothetical protein